MQINVYPGPTDLIGPHGDMWVNQLSNGDFAFDVTLEDGNSTYVNVSYRDVITLVQFLMDELALD
jgi:hypothetical protein